MLYQKIKSIADSKKIPISTIEKECNITPKYICTWDKIMPSADKLARVAKYIGVTVDELIEESASTIKEKE